ncbi:hypothetical protein ACHAW5_006748 [Stephanodiscus triporus]|uniref:Uncharacterized protein n=1 Tax=Stephanodiscus triporus TaxID=2934178 RepID=A0ABD3PTE3_9STRA
MEPALPSETENDGEKLKDKVEVKKLKDDIVVKSKDDEPGHVPRRTLVVYSGPTSMDRLQDKNGMYIDNMNYFIEHGISCFDDAPVSHSNGDIESVIVNYAFVLTQEVADYYTAPHGPLTKKIQECKGADKNAQGNIRWDAVRGRRWGLRPWSSSSSSLNPWRSAGSRQRRMRRALEEDQYSALGSIVDTDSSDDDDNDRCGYDGNEENAKRRHGYGNVVCRARAGGGGGEMGVGEGEGEFKCLAVLQSHGGDVLYGASYDDIIKVWAEEDGEWYCASTWDGSVHSSTDGSIGVWRKHTSAELSRRRGSSSSSSTRDGGSGSWDCVGRMSDAHSGYSITSVDCAPSRAGHGRVASCGGDDGINVHREEVINVGGGDHVVIAVAVDAHDGDVNCVRWHPLDGTCLASCGDDGAVIEDRVWWESR